MRMRKVVLAVMVASVAVSGCAKLGIGGEKGKKRTPTIGNRVAVLKSESGVEVEPALADVQVLLPPATANTDWSQSGGNASKTLEHVALGTALGKAWTAKIAGTSKIERLAASPVVADGKLFVVDVNGYIHAFNASTGGELWSDRIGDSPSKDVKKALFGGGVGVDGGIVYATNGMGDVEARTAGDGKRVWKKHLSSLIRGAPGIGNGNVYVMTGDNQLVALNVTNGETAWSESAAVELTGVFGSATPAIAQGTVVAGFSSGELNAYRYENGQPLWNDTLARTSISTSVSSISDIDADPVIDRGRVFAIGQGGRMVSLDLITGQRLWEINLSGGATPWVAGEWVFVVDGEARLLCISRTSGKVRWLTQLRHYKKEKKKKSEFHWVGPVLAGDRLIVANSEGEVVNVSPADGKVQSTVKIGAGVSLQPIVAGNMLYVLDDSGRITAWR
jgi:outer membrane protein assembly factor BamB